MMEIRRTVSVGNISCRSLGSALTRTLFELDSCPKALSARRENEAWLIVSSEVISDTHTPGGGLEA